MSTEEVNENEVGATDIQDIYLDEKVGKIKLDNECGAVLRLECYAKTNTSSIPSRCGKTDYYEVGQKRTLDLNTIPIADGCYVTAYANVRAGKDCSGTTWVIYDSKSSRTAVYTISGVIGFTKIGFNGITE